MESIINSGSRDSESLPLTAASAPMLRIDGVSVHFGGIKALDGVSFEVGEREICGLIGPNGAEWHGWGSAAPSRIWRYFGA